jgi:hypothetical protein
MGHPVVVISSDVGHPPMAMAKADPPPAAKDENKKARAKATAKASATTMAMGNGNEIGQWKRVVMYEKSDSWLGREADFSATLFTKT